MTTDNVADLAEARRPVRSADLSDGAVAHWAQVGWWQAIGLRRLLKSCDAHIKPLDDEHMGSVAAARQAERPVPERPERLVRLEEQRAVLEKLLGTRSAGDSDQRAEGLRWSILIPVLWTIGAAAAWWFVGFGTGGDILFDGSRQFVLLSMAIALGSYFATIVRELKIRRSRADGRSRMALLADIRYIRAGEYLVVLLGFAALLRIVLPMFPDTFGASGLTRAQADAGLVLLLAGVILHTVALHVREWFFR
jgi:hypothetical protein